MKFIYTPPSSMAFELFSKTSICVMSFEGTTEDTSTDDQLESVGYKDELQWD